VQLLLGAAGPNPTFVVNRRYDVLDANEAGRWLLSSFTEDPGRFAPPHNLGRLLVSPLGMRPYVANWPEVARKVLGRLRRDLGGAHARDSTDEALLAEITPALDELGPAPDPTAAMPILAFVNLARGSLQLRLFTVIATLGTPLDVTLAELRVETLFPADEESKRLLAARPQPGPLEGDPLTAPGSKDRSG
jgi:hypothetical protein